MGAKPWDTIIVIGGKSSSFSCSVFMISPQFRLLSDPSFDL